MFCKIGRDRTQLGVLWYRQVQRFVRESRDSVKQHPDKPAIGAIFVIKGR
jgi:hypothetical protein